jgi:DNA-binding beta-propeller fold protein YncE
VTVIDPTTYHVVRTFKTGSIPQHVVPAYYLSRLWVLNNQSSTLTPIDPLTGSDGSPLHVDDPYNMYFTPDGKYAITVAERRERLDFHDRRRTLAHGSPPRDRCPQGGNAGRYRCGGCR